MVARLLPDAVGAAAVCVAGVSLGDISPPIFLAGVVVMVMGWLYSFACSQSAAAPARPKCPTGASPVPKVKSVDKLCVCV